MSAATGHVLMSTPSCTMLLITFITRRTGIGAEFRGMLNFFVVISTPHTYHQRMWPILLFCELLGQNMASYLEILHSFCHSDFKLLFLCSFQLLFEFLLECSFLCLVFCLVVFIGLEKLFVCGKPIAHQPKKQCHEVTQALHGPTDTQQSPRVGQLAGGIWSAGTPPWCLGLLSTYTCLAMPGTHWKARLKVCGLINFEIHIIARNNSDGIFHLEADTGNWTVGRDVSLRKHTHAPTRAGSELYHIDWCREQLAAKHTDPKGNKAACWKMAMILYLEIQLLSPNPQPSFPAGTQNRVALQMKASKQTILYWFQVHNIVIWQLYTRCSSR